jgi:hypothetical protein
LDLSIPDHVSRMEAILLTVDLGRVRARMADPA